MTVPELPATIPVPRQTRRDVSWAVLFRLACTGVWVEWSNGHRDPSEAIRSGEHLVPMDAVADVRFDRVTRQRDMFSLHDLAPSEETELPAADDAARDDALRIVAQWCAETANGPQPAPARDAAADLMFRLEQAGHTLPEVI
jgi:hypothetical protein